MGWRKPGDDGQELCRQLDYIVDGLQALKTSIQMGLRLDGEGEMKVNSKELWCSALNRHRAGDSTQPILEDAKIALRQMKDARSLLSSISESLYDAIQTVTDDTSNMCRGIGLSLLPDDLLTYIFEMYVEMSISSNGYMDPETSESPQILASVSKRFRQVALDSPCIWKHVSFRFSRECVLMYKERCPNPIIHIVANDERSPVDMNMFHIYPYQQWRGLSLWCEYTGECHLVFQHLKEIIQAPLDALEVLLIDNGILSGVDEAGQQLPFVIHLDDEDQRTLSSWQMPNLTHLVLRNALPLAPLQCSNVTSLAVEVIQFCRAREDLNMVAFRSLLQSMPRIQSLHVYLLNVADAFYKASADPLSLPDLTSLKFEVGGTTSVFVVDRFMELVVTNDLTRLALRFFPYHNDKEHVFEDWVSTVFDRRHSSSRVGYKLFAKVEEFSLEVEKFQVSVETFHQIFSTMPNVHTVSLILPEDADLSLARRRKEDDMLQRLRSLQMKFLENIPDDFTTHLYRLNEYFRRGNSEGLERLELEYKRFSRAATAKAKLQKTLGERLHILEPKRIVWPPPDRIA
ncbi:hypothetical protein SCHPADRAFT_1001791 [Schizopora paradoxa]|uniref:Uncharacterized protein n=1 Tax=Schizopora paradoxa TaxID=27342 RepID=A0A0H2RR07_9AGAM|nr:hypothetical protein SCHPADRAFT_1001791 [Schizopora paradoxa]